MQLPSVEIKFDYALNVGTHLALMKTLMRQKPPMAIFFIFLTVAFTVAGQILVKQGMLEVGRNPSQLGLFPSFILRALTNVYVFLGFGCAFAASLTWIVAISRSDLSFAYPFMGLPIVTVLALSPMIFGEAVPITRWIGAIVVCIGIWIATR